MSGASSRPIHAAARRLLSPIQRFLEIEAAGGIVLAVATALALGWASSPWAASYRALWQTELALELGPWRFAWPLQHWINDGLMTVMFFVVGLEIRRELHDGVLRERRRAALPVLAAIGGMVVPAVIYGALNAGRAGAAGWAVPMATDIAFSLGVLGLLGARVAPALRVLLLALAVIDDLGAIVVIAVWYSAGLAPAGLAIAAGGAIAIEVLRAFEVRAPSAYVVPGVVIWAGALVTGIHPTLAGVALGLATPMRTADERAPAIELQHALHRWVSFVIMPVFALANAGVALGGAVLTGDAGWLFAGIAVGLAVGKPLGIVLACRLGAAARIAARPEGVAPRDLAVLGSVAGVGFTMSLFLAQLAFPAGPLLATAKLAILIGSLAAALLGLALGVIVLRRPA